VLTPRRLIAELTHRCPLVCPWCSNPPSGTPRERELDTAAWMQVFRQAADLGVREVHLSGGEPGARTDLVEIAASAHDAGLDTTLITSGVGIDTRTLRDLWEAGLHRIDLSLEDADAVASDRQGGRRGAFQRKLAFAAEAGRIGLPLSVHAVVRRDNAGRLEAFCARAVAMGARHITFQPVESVGRAASNHDVLSLAADMRAALPAAIARLRAKHDGRLSVGETDTCGDGLTILVSPSGLAGPSGVSPSPDGDETWRVPDRPLRDVWFCAPAFAEFRDRR
jgi:PqqA peptide cyclase